jgi:Integrase core domain
MQIAVENELPAHQIINQLADADPAKQPLAMYSPAEWIAGQVTDDFPWDEAPNHLIPDRDAAFGPAYARRIRAMGIRDHPTAPRSPCQNGHVERLIGSIRRECLDHVIVFGEAVPTRRPIAIFP